MTEDERGSGSDELDSLLVAIKILEENECTITFHENVMTLRRKDEPSVRVESIIHAAQIATKPRRYKIYENPSKPAHRWRVHIHKSIGNRPRCYLPLLGEGWTIREVSEEELERLADITCWACRYLVAPVFEQRKIERAQGVESGHAKPPLRVQDPLPGDDFGVESEKEIET